jgi:hypothetical protein
MISGNLVEKLVEDLRKGETTFGNADEELTRLCDCGVLIHIVPKKH